MLAKLTKNNIFYIKMKTDVGIIELSDNYMSINGINIEGEYRELIASVYYNNCLHILCKCGQYTRVVSVDFSENSIVFAIVDLQPFVTYGPFFYRIIDCVFSLYVIGLLNDEIGTKLVISRIELPDYEVHTHTEKYVYRSPDVVTPVSNEQMAIVGTRQDDRIIRWSDYTCEPKI